MCSLAVLAAVLGTGARGELVPALSASAAGGSWLATAYGPPWGGIEGDGITATGLNLTAGPPA